ncbi:MAG: hypothetical protein OXI87_10315 [Albidovulum sp.]|nr:hypothetical protein [Albidovulum sp.]
MWSVGISVSPSLEATRLGYDDRQVNRIVVRMAQYFLDQEMRVIFGHDWRDDGVMRAVADFACVVAARVETGEERERQQRSDETAKVAKERMLNLVPTERQFLNRAALEAERESGGVLRVIPAAEAQFHVSESERELVEFRVSGEEKKELRNVELTRLRHYLTSLLNPGCRVCFGGKVDGFQGKEPGVIEEARLALLYEKPLYLMGGFGGATQSFGIDPGRQGMSYWNAMNGLTPNQKRELFETTDVEQAIELISRGIDSCKNRETYT